MMIKLWCFFVILVVIFISKITCSNNGNILFLNGIASPSHHLWNRVLIKGLAAKGYNITMVSVDNDKNPSPNIHYIHLEEAYNTLYNKPGESIDLMEYASRPLLVGALQYNDWCDLTCDGIYLSKGLDQILNYPDNFKYKAVIYDFTCGPCLLPLLHKFNYPPLVAVTAFNNPPYSIQLTGGQKFPGLVPHYFLNYSNLMNLPQRLLNHLMYFLDYYGRQQIFFPIYNKKIKDRFGYENMPKAEDLELMTKLMLINSDNAVDFPEPLQPNMVQVAGLQIAEPKPLEGKLKEFVESSEKGTVLMSLGTNIKSNMLGDKILMEIIQTFAEIPQYNFLWKFESEAKDLPAPITKNVMISNFFPQNDILAHQNVKAFVTHAGGLSTQESMWYGKPMIAIPFLVDQHRTAGKSVLFGVAVTVDFREITLKNLKSAILEVLENPKYQEKAKKVSKIFQDKPMKPLETAVWWIEHVMRNPDSPIYDPVAIKQGFFISNSYDVLLVLLVIIFTITFIAMKIVKVVIHFLVRLLSSKKSDDSKVKRN